MKKYDNKTRIVIEIDPNLYNLFAEKCKNEFKTNIIDKIVSLIEADVSWT